MARTLGPGLVTESKEFRDVLSRNIQLWMPSIWRPLWSARHGDAVMAASFGAGLDNQPILATGSRDGRVRIWDYDPAAALGLARHDAPFTGPAGENQWVAAVACAHKRGFVIAAGWEGNVGLWERNGEKHWPTTPEPYTFAPSGKTKRIFNTVAISFDDSYVAAGDREGSVLVWPWGAANHGTPPEIVNSTFGWVTALAWSRDRSHSDLLAVGNIQGRVYLVQFDHADGGGLTLDRWKFRPLRLDYSIDSKGTPIINSTATSRPRRSAVYGLDFTDDGGLVACTDDGAIAYWSKDRLNERNSLGAQPNDVVAHPSHCSLDALAVAPSRRDETLFATAGADRFVHLWKIAAAGDRCKIVPASGSSRFSPRSPCFRWRSHPTAGGSPPAAATAFFGSGPRRRTP